jgi:hypothetical protein
MSDPVFEQDDYFKIDPELHLVGDIGPLEHFPGVQMWWRAIDNMPPWTASAWTSAACSPNR